MYLEKLLAVIASGATIASVLASPGAAAVSTPAPAVGTLAHSHEHSSAPAAQRCQRADEFAPDPRLGDRACALGNGLFKVRTAHGDQVTHFDAPRPEDKGVRDTVISPTITSLAARSYHCAADSYRIQLVYLIPAGAPDASSTMVPLIRQHFIQSNDMVSNRAAQYGGDLSLRVACDSSGQPAVRVLRSSHNTSSIGAIDQEVARQGQRMTGQDNVVYWGDGGCGGGVAYGSGDTRPGVENNVNNAPGIAVVYGRCPFTYLLHEQGHSMGAVLPNTPNSSGAGHCNDDADVMCYKDGGPRSGNYRSNVCPSPNGNLDYYWDCNVNDYFHPNPPAGSFLATNWNLASCANRIVYRPNCGPVSTAAYRSDATTRVVS
ncbi:MULTISPECIES: hypothetical protein [Saccharothrix]|uniref:hypothetical protein n=1 Tax=Saccharothrix TaxID=2071 RepID=UPI000938E5F4|nr:hypothetical protein [Saccharothrix sp. CB00851]OKI21096.1 hypothetical protein A6A25_36835 [Saccharothrix sp. CB00851]